jgi:hypothetical protein
MLKDGLWWRQWYPYFNLEDLMEQHRTTRHYKEY